MIMFRRYRGCAQFADQLKRNRSFDRLQFLLESRPGQVEADELAVNQTMSSFFSEQSWLIQHMLRS
jgi:hypothetical protein